MSFASCRTRRLSSRSKGGQPPPRGDGRRRIVEARLRTPRHRHLRRHLPPARVHRQTCSPPARPRPRKCAKPSAGLVIRNPVAFQRDPPRPRRPARTSSCSVTLSLDVAGAYYVAVPLDAPLAIDAETREVLRCRAQLLANLFYQLRTGSHLQAHLDTLHENVQLEAPPPRLEVTDESEAFRIYRFRDGAWSEIILGAIVGAARRGRSRPSSVSASRTAFAHPWSRRVRPRAPIPSPSRQLRAPPPHLPSRSSRPRSARKGTGREIRRPVRHSRPPRRGRACASRRDLRRANGRAREQQHGSAASPFAPEPHRKGSPANFTRTAQSGERNFKATSKIEPSRESIDVILKRRDSDA